MKEVGAMVRVAINGFGRIGRQFFKAAWERRNEGIEIVAINDIGNLENLAYLLKYDSVFGKWNHEVKVENNHLVVDGVKIKFVKEPHPELLPWRDLNVEVVVESSGRFTKRNDAAKHLEAGARKVLITAPSDDADFTIIKGVNEHLYDKEKHVIISNGSCTTNAVTPTIKVLDDNFGIEYAFVSTIHAYTATQGIVDRPDPKHIERGRAAAVNIVPTSTGASKAVVKALPHLKGKIIAMAYRVPVVNGSVVEINAILKRTTTKEEVNWLFKEVSKYHLKGVLGYSDMPLVSTDIIGSSFSGIISGKHTHVDGNKVRIVVWYDNEWGYSNRLVDVLKLL